MIGQIVPLPLVGAGPMRKDHRQELESIAAELERQFQLHAPSWTRTPVAEQITIRKVLEYGVSTYEGLWKQTAVRQEKDELRLNQWKDLLKQMWVGRRQGVIVGGGGTPPTTFTPLTLPPSGIQPKGFSVPVGLDLPIPKLPGGTPEPGTEVWKKRTYAEVEPTKDKTFTYIAIGGAAFAALLAVAFLLRR